MGAVKGLMYEAALFAAELNDRFLTSKFVWGVDIDGLIVAGVIFNNTFICDPFRDESGQFPYSPEFYGLTALEAQTMVDGNRILKT